MSEMRILLTGGVGEYEEKKSRFIATLRPVSTPEEAAAFFDEMKKKYWDARHNCSACVIGRNNEYSRCSDDGEPSGTAGRPMLEVLTGAEVHNAAVVVTRYFGGVLLGTGGLVRAYTKAVQEGINNSTLAIEREGERLLLALDYSDVDRVLNLLKNSGQNIDKSDYGTDVTMEIVCAVEKKEELVRSLTELTAGRIMIEEMGRCDFLDTDKIIIQD
ncbi:MAG: YigZ family protein [Lachnospiraceae bacterium]|nr:YigZ family protein [Lachnospiraceae bacterium]